jgi:ribosome recycling factor
MIDDIKEDAAGRMAKSVDALGENLAKVRTGRAHPSMLDHVVVSYYGADTPLKQVANVGVEDARTLTVQPWEQGMVQAVEKAILESNLGVTPNTAGTLIRLPIPPLTEERRKDMTRIVRAEAEQARVAVRNIRRDAIEQLKKLTKDKLISEDDERRGQDETQKLTDRFVADIDKLSSQKEAEVMTV